MEKKKINKSLKKAKMIDQNGLAEREPVFH